MKMKRFCSLIIVIFLLDSFIIAQIWTPIGPNDFNQPSYYPVSHTSIATDKVTVHYTGTLLNGKVFDSSIGGEPVTFPLNQVIRGWTEGVQLMSVGSKYKFFINF